MSIIFFPIKNIYCSLRRVTVAVLGFNILPVYGSSTRFILQPGHQMFKQGFIHLMVPNILTARFNEILKQALIVYFETFLILHKHVSFG